VARPLTDLDLIQKEMIVHKQYTTKRPIYLNQHAQLALGTGKHTIKSLVFKTNTLYDTIDKVTF
jgi:hypothetical protein